HIAGMALEHRMGTTLENRPGSRAPQLRDQSHIEIIREQCTRRSQPQRVLAKPVLQRLPCRLDESAAGRASDTCAVPLHLCGTFTEVVDEHLWNLGRRRAFQARPSLDRGDVACWQELAFRTRGFRLIPIHRASNPFGMLAHPKEFSDAERSLELGNRCFENGFVRHTTALIGVKKYIVTLRETFRYRAFRNCTPIHGSDVLLQLQRASDLPCAVLGSNRVRRDDENDCVGGEDETVEPRAPGLPGQDVLFVEIGLEAARYQSGTELLSKYAIGPRIRDEDLCLCVVEVSTGRLWLIHAMPSINSKIITGARACELPHRNICP